MGLAVAQGRRGGGGAPRGHQRATARAGPLLGATPDAMHARYMLVAWDLQPPAHAVVGETVAKLSALTPSRLPHLHVPLTLPLPPDPLLALSRPPAQSGRRDVEVEIVFPVAPSAIATPQQRTGQQQQLELPTGLALVPGGWGEGGARC